MRLLSIIACAPALRRDEDLVRGEVVRPGNGGRWGPAALTRLIHETRRLLAEGTFDLVLVDIARCWTHSRPGAGVTSRGEGSRW